MGDESVDIPFQRFIRIVRMEARRDRAVRRFYGYFIDLGIAANLLGHVGGRKSRMYACTMHVCYLWKKRLILDEKSFEDIIKSCVNI